VGKVHYWAYVSRRLLKEQPRDTDMLPYETAKQSIQTRREDSMLKKGILLLICITLNGCLYANGPNTYSARLYNTQTGEVSHGWFHFAGTRSGEVGIVLPNGEALRGEYSTAPAGDTTWGSVYASAYGSGGYASVHGSGYKQNVPNALRGQAVVVGNRGTMIQCEYVTNNSRYDAQGHGGCKDNRGNYYRLMFGGKI